MIAYLVTVLLWIAGIFTLVAAIGLLRFSDVFLRMHAATKVGTIGVVSSLLALTLYFDDPAIRARAVLIALFLFITAPIVGHVLSRAALVAGVPLSANTKFNEWDSASMGSPSSEEDEE